MAGVSFLLVVSLEAGPGFLEGVEGVKFSPSVSAFDESESVFHGHSDSS